MSIGAQPKALTAAERATGGIRPRAGALIDTTINPNLSPAFGTPLVAGGPQRPQATFNTAPLLAQGLNLGAKFEF